MHLAQRHGLLPVMTTLKNTGLLVSASVNTPAISGSAMNYENNWQMKMIHQPSQGLLEREAKGFINIFDGFTDVQVSQVMDKNFDRIDSIMFISVRQTVPTAEVMIDAETGEEMIEEDGCK